MRVHKHTPYVRIEVIHIVDKHSHIFSIHMTSHPHRLIEVIHCLILIHIYDMKPNSYQDYTSYGGIGLYELCPLPSGVSLKSPGTNEFPDPPSYSPGAPIVVDGVRYYTLI
jgi:hypothetical protein